MRNRGFFRVSLADTYYLQYIHTRTLMNPLSSTGYNGSLREGRGGGGGKGIHHATPVDVVHLTARLLSQENNLSWLFPSRDFLRDIYIYLSPLGLYYYKIIFRISVRPPLLHS
jgi:hypothetical protein